MTTTTKEPTRKAYNLLPSWGFIPAARDLALKRLAGAIIGQAARDARKDDETGTEARRWLLSRDCQELAEFIELDFRAVRAWVDSGCPDWRAATETTAETVETGVSTI